MGHYASEMACPKCGYVRCLCAQHAANAARGVEVEEETHYRLKLWHPDGKDYIAINMHNRASYERWAPVFKTLLKGSP